MVHRLVEDIAGYAILIDVESNDQIRTLLEPLPITTYVNYEISPRLARRAPAAHPRTRSRRPVR